MRQSCEGIKAMSSRLHAFGLLLGSLFLEEEISVSTRQTDFIHEIGVDFAHEIGVGLQSRQYQQLVEGQDGSEIPCGLAHKPQSHRGGRSWRCAVATIPT